MQQKIFLDEKLQSAKDLAWWLYLLQATSLIFSLGALSVLLLIANYLNLGNTAGSFVYSHHRWQIRSFFWYLFWIGISVLAWATVIGIPLAILIIALAWLWKAYRIIKGWLDLNNNKPMPT